MPPVSPADSTGSAVPRTRRFHNKSRTGCKGCKERRIKCDEGRPICSNCIRRTTVCEYHISVEEASESQSASSSVSTPETSQVVTERRRKSRRRTEPETPAKFTFVDVNKSLARKRKRGGVDDATNPKNELDKANSPASSEDAEVAVRMLSGLISAVDQALERGQQLAQIMVVSKQPSQIRSDNEYIITSNGSPVAPGSNSLFTGMNTGGFMSHIPIFEYRPSRTPSTDSPTSSISLWQSSPSTSLRQAGTSVKISMQDYYLINTYRNFTCHTFPYVTPARNPWKTLTFDLQFRNPYLYHTIIAVTAAHVRHLQGVSTPSLLEVSHYVKGLASYREQLAENPIVALAITKTGEIPVESQGLFATSALLGAYMWATELTELHTWLVAKFSMTVGTREITHEVWDASLFKEFREAVGDSLQEVTEKLHDFVTLGVESGIRFPALEALATGQTTSQLLLLGALDRVNDVDAPAEQDGEVVGALGPEIYDTRYSWIDQHNCPFYEASNGSMVCDIGSLHRLFCIIVTLESPDARARSTETMAAAMRMMFVWPGMSCYVVLEKLKLKDKRVYLLLAYYYAAVVKLKQLNLPSFDTISDQKKLHSPPEEILKSWWLMRNPRLILRGIVDWLGKDWVQWLDWPLKVLRDEEMLEGERIEGLWEPAMEKIWT